MFNKKVIIDSLRNLSKPSKISNKNSFDFKEGGSKKEGFISAQEGVDTPIYKAVKVGASPIEGKGLFADQAIRKGDVIGISHIRQKFMKNGEEYQAPFPSTVLGYYNHSEESNVYEVDNGDHILMVAGRDIQRGQELTSDYSKHNIEDLEVPEDFKRGGSTKRPKMPKGKSPRSYSRSLEATNKLFTEHPFFAKPKSRKNKIYDPRAQYYAKGGIPYNYNPFTSVDPEAEETPIPFNPIRTENDPEDYNQFLEYSESAPENRRPYSFYGDPNEYDHYGMWDALGKPKNFEEALQMNPDWQPDPYDGYYHGFSVNPNTGVFLKSGKPGFKEGDTTWMEINGHYLSPRANESTPVYDPDLQRFKYIPKEKDGGLTQYAPGGASADPPDWLTKKGANIYFNPTYMNNFTGGTNSLERNMLGSYRTGFSPVVGIEGSLSKSRRADSEGGRGWLYNAYAGLNPNAIKEGNYTPSAGLNFDFENSPQDKNFRPFAQIGADYNPDTGLNVGATSGARFAFTPYGNKRIKPGYATGHLDIYGGVRGGLGEVQEGWNSPTGGVTYGARVHGKYMPERKSVLGKLMGKGAYFYGDAGIQFDPQKGQIGQKVEDYTYVTGALDDSRNTVPATTVKTQDSGLKFGNTIYANVGVKKELDDIKFKKDDRARKIQEIEDNEKRAFQENEIKEIEEPKEEKKKKNDCPPGYIKDCRRCPCYKEKAKHPRWLQEGGIPVELTQDEIQKYVDGGYIVEDISVPSLNKFAPGGAVKPVINENGKPACPEGYTYNPETGWCEKLGDDCPEGYVKDPETGRCRSISYKAIPGVLDKNKKAIDRSKLERKYTDWPEDLNLTQTDFDDTYGDVYIQPAGSYTIYSDNKDYLTTIPFYPDLNYKVEVDADKPEGFDKSTNTYYVKSKDTHQYEKYRQWQILKEEEKQNLDKIQKAGLKTKIGETILYDPNSDYKFSHYNSDLNNEPDNEATRRYKQQRDAFKQLYEDPEYIPDVIKNQLYNDYQKKRKQGNIESEQCPECSLYHGSTYDISDDYVRENINLSKVTKEYPDVIFKKDEDGYEDAQNINWEKQYTYTDPNINRKIPTYNLPKLELEKPDVQDYNFPGVRHYAKNKKYLDWRLQQRYNKTSPVKVREKVVMRKEDPLIRFITGYDRAKGTPKLHKEHREWNKSFNKEYSKMYHGSDDINFPGFGGIPIASWKDLKARKEYKKYFKDYVKNELPALRERNRLAQEAYNQELIDYNNYITEEENKRKSSGLPVDKYGGLIKASKGREKKASKYKAPTIEEVKFVPAKIQSYVPESKEFTLQDVVLPDRIVPGRDYVDVQHKMANLRKDLNISGLEHFVNKVFPSQAPKIGLAKDSGLVIDPGTGRLFDSNTRYWLNREYGHIPHPAELLSNAYSSINRDYGSGLLHYSDKPFENMSMGINYVDKYGQPVQYDAMGNIILSNPFKKSNRLVDMFNQPIGGPLMLGMGMMGKPEFNKEIKNPDYFTQLLNTYDTKRLSYSSRKYYQDLINSVKNQNGLATERQYNELQRLKTGDFDFGKRGYAEGGLVKFVSGGSNDCPDGYIKDENGNCIPSNYDPNIANENTEFLKSMANSPLFTERYARMVGKPIEEVTQEADDYRKQILQNLETVQMGDSAYPPKPYEGGVGAYYLHNPTINEYSEKLNEVQKLMNDIPNKGKYNKDLKARYQSIYDDAKKEYDDKLKTTHKLYFKNWNKPYDLHERSHASVAGELEVAKPYKFKDLSQKSHLEKLIFDNLYPPNQQNYYESADEIKSAKDVSAEILMKLGLYDPINENFTPEHYKKLIELKKSGKLDPETEGQIDRITTPFDEEETIRMFNDIVQNESDNDIQYGKYGGQFELGDEIELTKKQVAELKKYGYTLEQI